MCGLMGFVAHESLSDQRISQVRGGMGCQRHRGPDDTDVWHDDRACFGFNRLSIIDIENSSQPLTWGPADNPERYTLIFNGEIYNYVELRERLIAERDAHFATSGDGETIVVGYHYYGAEWVKQLRGMFAFAIWDSQEKILFGARDWFGIKPLYYAQTHDGFAFSSEAKSLRTLTGSADVDPVALQHYLVLQYVPEPESADKHLRRINSGTSFRVKDGKLTKKRYFFPDLNPASDGSPAATLTGSWAIPAQTDPHAVIDDDRSQRVFSAPKWTTPEELYDRIAEALDDSVAKHMRADVTVGSFLSGGIDSTAIAALAKRYNPDLLTFTTGFEREGYSEIDVAAESAKAIGVENIVKVVSEQELCETLPAIVWYLDDPVADPALVPLYFVAREARKHVKVVLSGEGADELFGGYNIYREPLSLRPLTRLPDRLRQGLGAVSKVLPQGMRGKDMLRRGSISMEDRYYGNARIFREEQLSTILKTYNPDISFHDVTDSVYAQSKDWDPVARMQHIDLFTWLRGDILVKADRVTMANSLELRVPFLDKEVYAIARTIPMEHKITPSQSKVALRKALETIVPGHVLNRRKLGFPVPIRIYLRDDYGYEWARSIITAANTTRYIDSDEALRLLDAHRAGDADYSRHIWTIIVFMLWYDIFVTGEITPEIPEPHYPVRL